MNETDLEASSESKGLIRPCREEEQVWPALMTLVTCPVYGREGAVLGQLRIKAAVLEAEGSKQAVTWRHEHKSHHLEPFQTIGRRDSSSLH